MPSHCRTRVKVFLDKKTKQYSATIYSIFPRIILLVGGTVDAIQLLTNPQQIVYLRGEKIISPAVIKLVRT